MKNITDVTRYGWLGGVGMTAWLIILITSQVVAAQNIPQEGNLPNILIFVACVCIGLCGIGEIINMINFFIIPRKKLMVRFA